MRAAPPVAVTASGGRPWQATQAVLPALAVAALAAWALQWLDGPVWLSAPMALLTGAVAWPTARPQAADLRWDGANWSVDGQPGRLAVALDLGGFLLLRLRPPRPGRERWLAVTAAEAGAAWPALRGALYSPPPSTTPRGRPPERAAD